MAERLIVTNATVDVYHTDEDCEFLRRADNYREASDEEIEWHDLNECGHCGGDDAA